MADTVASVLISDMYRELNVIAAGASPTTAQAAEGLTLLNRFIFAVFGDEMGEELTDWPVPAPQRTAEVAADYPQMPYPQGLDGLAMSSPLANSPSLNIYPYPPSNSRIVFGSVANTVWFPESPNDGARMAVVQGSGAGDAGIPGTASGTYTQTQLPGNTETVTLATKDGTAAAVYTWKTALASAFDVLIGASVAASLYNLASAINLWDGAGVLYGTATTANHDVTADVNQAAGTLTATANLSGTGGNSLASTTTAAHGSWGAATLAGGTTGAILTLDGNGRTIEGAGTQAYSTPVAARQWLYRADLGDWREVATLLATDTCPFPPELDDLWATMGAIRLAPRYSKIVSQDTKERALMMMKKLKVRYRQAANSVYGSDQFPRALESFISGQWTWTILAAFLLQGVLHAGATFI